MQKFFKLLRFHKFPCRYFVVGEFGTLKGRAHWHVMVYWKERVPWHKLDKNFMQKHWPHGWSFWSKPTHAAVRYNCKYIQKDMGADERQAHLSMSKNPPLGARYFQQEAERYVEQGLAPQSLEYKFPEVTRQKEDGSREVIPFRLKDKSAELFLEHYLAAWVARWPHRPTPKSVLVDEFLNPELKEVRLIHERLLAMPPQGRMWNAAQRIQVRLDIDALEEIRGRAAKEAEWARRVANFEKRPFLVWSDEKKAEHIRRFLANGAYQRMVDEAPLQIYHEYADSWAVRQTKPKAEWATKIVIRRRNDDGQEG